MRYLGFDIGGSAIKYGIVIDGPKIIEQGKIERQETFDQMIEEMLKVYKRHEDVEGIAISAPGTVDTHTGIIGGESALEYIHGPNFKTIFKDKTGHDIAIENDANCAALSEAYFGQGKEVKRIAYVVIGSGIGGAILQNQQIHYGANSFGGEFGYQILNEKLQTWSGLGSTVNLVNRVRKLKDNYFIDGKEVFLMAKKDEEVNKMVENFYLANAIGLFNIQMSYDPDLILLGGGITANHEVIDRIQLKVEEIKKEKQIKIPIKIEVGKFGADANIYGAVANLINNK